MFRKSIFKKFVSITLGLLILSFVITGGFLYYFLNNFVLEEKQKNLEQSANDVKGLFYLYIENAGNPVALQLFENSLKLFSISGNSMIWIVESNGHIIMSAPELPNAIAAKYIDETNYIKLPNEKQYKDVMGENSANITETGDFYGFFKDDYFSNKGDSWLTFKMPFKVTSTNGKQETLAAVFLHTPIPEIQKAKTSVFNLYIVSGGVAIFIAVIFVYIFSLRFTKPLKEINAAAKIIAAGEFSNRIAIHSDDEIGQLAQSFNQMVEDLQKLEEMRSGFIANVSHELRTPMTSIRGFIEGILDGTIPPEKQRTYLTIVRDETIRLSRLVNDLLDLARREAGETKLNLQPFDINELIRVCVIKLETLITSKDIEIEADFESENIVVMADRDSIERVIINLIHNAVKFSNIKGKILIETTSSKDKVFVSVQDFGIGINEEEQKRIWDRFYKTDKSRGDKTGTGLGLAIVKNIITEHGQDISVSSKIGEGTKFVFSLDIYKNI